MTEVGGVDRFVSRGEDGAWRLQCARLRWDERGSPESFMLVYAVKSEGRLFGARLPQQSQRSEPFLRDWQGAMARWASRNCQVRFRGAHRG